MGVAVDRQLGVDDDALHATVLDTVGDHAVQEVGALGHRDGERLPGPQCGDDVVAGVGADEHQRGDPGRAAGAVDGGQGELVPGAPFAAASTVCATVFPSPLVAVRLPP